MKFLLLFILVFMATPCHAQEADRYVLMKQAVEYSTKADAYNAYCDEPSSLSSAFLDRFDVQDDLSVEQKGELVSIMEDTVQKFVRWFKKDSPDCKALNFMMGRLEVMRKLKDVSYLLNGVDLSSLPPDNIPELKDLMINKEE